MRQGTAAPGVRSVADEERRMGSCPCGGAWAVAAEDIVPLHGRWFDSLVVRCSHCGHTKPFLFDISSFFVPVARVWHDYGVIGR